MNAHVVEEQPLRWAAALKAAQRESMGSVRKNAGADRSTATRSEMMTAGSGLRFILVCVHLPTWSRAEHSMGMPYPETDWTVEMLDALPDDGQRYEIIDGVLYVTPPPSDVHQLIVAAFHAPIDRYLRTARVARALFSPADVRTGDRKRNRVQPDIFAVRLVDGKRPSYPYGLSDLLLAIEVESPSDPRLDYVVKRELYLSHGIPEYWIANAEKRIVTRWRSLSDPGTVFDSTIEWHPGGMARRLVLQLPSLFEDALS